MELTGFIKFNFYIVRCTWRKNGFFTENYTPLFSRTLSCPPDKLLSLSRSFAWWYFFRFITHNQKFSRPMKQLNENINKIKVSRAYYKKAVVCRWLWLWSGTLITIKRFIFNHTKKHKSNVCENGANSFLLWQSVEKNARTQTYTHFIYIYIYLFALYLEEKINEL